MPTHETALRGKRKMILDFIADHVYAKGYPPSVREIGEAVGLASPSTVHSHLSILEKQGLLVRDPTKPRAMELRYDPTSGAAIESRPVRNVPLIGDVAAGTDVLARENVEDLLPLPEDFTGSGQLFMLRVRGDSMVEAGILDGDFVVVRSQPDATNGEIVVAGIPGPDDGEGGEGTVKTFFRRDGKVVLRPSNSAYSDMIFEPEEVKIYGKVVTVLRKL